MYKHNTAIRVRYEETDRMGVVYYGKYFVWFEVARTEHFRELGLSYSELEKRGIRIMVVDARCIYRNPVTYDDIVDIQTRILNVKNTSMVFTYNLYNEGKLVATGETGHVFTDEKGRPIRIPTEIKRSINASI